MARVDDKNNSWGVPKDMQVLDYANGRRAQEGFGSVGSSGLSQQGVLEPLNPKQKGTYLRRYMTNYSRLMEAGSDDVIKSPNGTEFPRPLFANIVIRDQQSLERLGLGNIAEKIRAAVNARLEVASR